MLVMADFIYAVHPVRVIQGSSKGHPDGSAFAFYSASTVYCTTLPLLAADIFIFASSVCFLGWLAFNCVVYVAATRLFNVVWGLVNDDVGEEVWGTKRFALNTCWNEEISSKIIGHINNDKGLNACIAIYKWMAESLERYKWLEQKWCKNGVDLLKRWQNKRALKPFLGLGLGDVEIQDHILAY